MSEEELAKAIEAMRKDYDKWMKSGLSWGNMALEENEKEKKERNAKNTKNTQTRSNRNTKKNASSVPAAARSEAGSNNGWTRVSRNRRPAQTNSKKTAKAGVVSRNKKQEIIEKCKKEFMKNGTLKKIKRKCRWHEQGKTCVCHQAGVCPFIHKGDSNWK
jgi:hypothetical protein